MTGSRSGRIVAAAFLLAIAGAAAFTTIFALGPNTALYTQAEGAAVGLALLGLALAFTLWEHDLIPPERVEDPHEEGTTETDRAIASEALVLGARTVTSRHRSLVVLGCGAVGALGAAALFPLRSLGPSPENTIGLSDWRAGLVLVRSDGTPVRADDVPRESVVTAFPAGYVGADRHANMLADAVMVMHVSPVELQLPSARQGWTPDGFIAYSKTCTHAGCAVSLYRSGTQQLLCPCHQSTFDVLRGARVVFGPAARPLPQLPLAVGPDGTLRAAGNLSGVVGPANWDFP